MNGHANIKKDRQAGRQIGYITYLPYPPLSLPPPATLPHIKPYHAIHIPSPRLASPHPSQCLRVSEYSTLFFSRYPNCYFTFLLCRVLLLAWLGILRDWEWEWEEEERE